LELLESQLGIAQKTLNELKEFTAGIQIKVQGSLTSAASVKAASLNLASHTNSTAHEIDQVRNIC
jgi:hypothetical protein